MKNILCLSSGLMPQYRLDILRAIALPPHAIIQFRYSEQLVEPGLRDAFSNNRCTGRRVLIGHVDGNASRFLPESVCPITLCREAFIQKSQRSGSYFVLRMALGSMVLSHDWQGAQAEIEPLRPRKKDEVNPSSDEHHPGLSGFWCFETSLTTTPEGNLDSVGMWEAVVKQLWQSPDFAKQPFFFAVDGLYMNTDGSSERQLMSEGRFTLRADKEYELRLLHWHPEADSRPSLDRGTKMVVGIESPQLRSITSPQLPIDSPYDVKAYRVRTGSATKEEFSSFVIRVDGEDGKPANDQPELFLPVQIRPSYLKVLAVTTSLAILLWLQQLVPLILKGPVDRLTALATFLLSALAAFVVVFGLKKPLS